MGLIASHASAHVVRSVVDASGRASGRAEYTARSSARLSASPDRRHRAQAGLTTTSAEKINTDPRISDQVVQRRRYRGDGGVSFVSSDNVEQAATDAGIDSRPDVTPWSPLRRRPSAR